ncbi:MAG: NUDIX hydrolase [Coriobacteriales bacterium]
MSKVDHPRPGLTADTVVVRGAPGRREVLLIRRGNPPYQGIWALPGGFLDPFEPPVDAARRELAEETGLVYDGPLVLVGVYGEPGRDPRGWTVSAAYLALAPDDSGPVAGADDAAEARWFPVGDLPALAFDHVVIVRDALTALGEELPGSGAAEPL